MLDGLLNQESELLRRKTELTEMLEQIELSGSGKEEIESIELELEQVDQELEYVQTAIDEINEFQQYEREYDAI